MNVPQTAEDWIDALHAIPEDDRESHVWVFTEAQRGQVIEALKRIVAAPDEIRPDGSLVRDGLVFPPQVLGCPLRFDPQETPK